MTAVEFRMSVVNELRKKGYNKTLYQSFDELLEVLTVLLHIGIEFFVSEIAKMKSPHDLCAFIVNYEASKKINPGDIAFKQLCKSIFCLLPKLQLNSSAIPVFPATGEADISSLMGIHTCVLALEQFFGTLITYQSEMGVLLVSDSGWSFHFKNDEDFELNKRFQNAVCNGALEKYCDDDFVAESFIDKFREIFYPIEDQLYNKIFNRSFVYDCNKLSEQEFIRIISGEVPQQGIIDLTDIVTNNKNNPCIQGLIFDEDNSDIFLAISKPHNKKYRTRFRPIIRLNIDGCAHYITTQSIYFEAMSELAKGHYAHNELPDEWSHIKELKKSAKDIFKKHSDFLEQNIAEVVKNKFFFLSNVTSLASISCVTAPVQQNTNHKKKKTVGEIDFIIIDDKKRTIYVADAKYLKPAFFFPSFATDADKFRKEGGYEEKLSYKISWVADNIDLLCREIRRKDVASYKVEGFFITDNLVYYSLISKYPIIPISNLLDYLNTFDRYCALPKIS